MVFRTAADWGNAVRVALRRTRSNAEPREVNCVGCGFLAGYHYGKDEFREFGQTLRRIPTGWDSVDGWAAIPVCFVSAHPIADEIYNTASGYRPIIAEEMGQDDPSAVDWALRKTDHAWIKSTAIAIGEFFKTTRVCESFITFRPGYSPKEHRDMREREEWNKYLDDQRKSDRRWRIVELVVLTLGAGMFTLIGALISR